MKKSSKVSLGKEEARSTRKLGEKGRPLLSQNKSSFGILQNKLEELKKKGEVEFREGHLEDQYVVLLNPPKYLVEKIQKAEEAKKKKK